MRAGRRRWFPKGTIKSTRLARACGEKKKNDFTEIRKGEAGPCVRGRRVKKSVPKRNRFRLARACGEKKGFGKIAKPYQHGWPRHGAAFTEIRKGGKSKCTARQEN